MNGVHTMYKIVVKSPLGIVKRDLITGFESEHEALAVCMNMDWIYVDENRFEWCLDIEEY